MFRTRLSSAWILAAAVLLGAAGAQDSRVESASTRLIHPSARWIWDGSAPATDAYRIFRKTFTPSPSSASLRISADREYRLFLNGVFFARGPAASPPGRAAVDEINLTGSLLPGKNVLAIIVYSLGVPSFQRPLGKPGLIAEISMTSERIVTDSSWLVRDAWWVPTGERFTPMREFTEHLDARREPAGWSDADGDESGWKPAVETDDGGRVLDASEFPATVSKPLLPLGIVFTTPCAAAPRTLTEAAKELAGIPTKPLPPDLVTGQPRLRTNDHTGANVRPGEDGVAIAFDFGREVSGFPVVDVESEADGVVLDLGYGEGRDGFGHVTVFHQGYPACDRMTLRKGPQTLQVFNFRAFRYLVVAVRGGAVRLKSASILESGCLLKERGSFVCSDPELTKIWQAGRLTSRLCIDQGYLDCPWRERGQYIGDAIVEFPAALYAFGDTWLCRRFLRQAAFCQPADGLLEPAYPCDWTAWHGTRGPNRIPGYGALWVVLLEDWFRTEGAAALIHELMPVVDRQLAWFDEFKDSRGLIGPVPEWNFIDWSELDPKTALACLNLQYLMALRAAAGLEGVLPAAPTTRPKPSRAAQADAFAAAFHRAHWDADKGLYRDGERLYSAHTNALALLTLVDDGAIARRILAGVVSTTRPGSPYFDAYVLRALAKHGLHKEALAVIRERWSPMLAGGGSTLWEMYTPAASLCHGWSAAPTWFLPREILGISWNARSRSVRFAPRLGGLAWAQGLAPLPGAEVSARVEVSEGSFQAQISTGARGAPVDVDVPAERGAILLVDDAPHEDARFEGGSFRFRLPGGPHRISVRK